MTQPQTTVSATPPPAAAPPAAGTPPAATTPAVDAAALQKQIDDLKAAAAEKDRTIEFLHSQKKQEPAAKTPPAEEDDTDILDVLTTKGAKGFDELLEKRGYVKRDQVDNAINSKASELAKERELMETYPELADKSSDFFKQTAIHYGNLVKSGVAPSVATEVAAERTALAFLREGKMQTPAQKKDTEKTQREEERRARIAAQGGDRGVRGQREDEQDDELSVEQKHIARMMGITEEAYKERAKKGVAMRGAQR